jgi:SNF2 family DNA or RNA helicase
MVEIKKLRSNYELRYSYLKRLTDFIKTLPKDQQKTKMDQVLNPDGSMFEDWYRVVSEAGMGKVLLYLNDNAIPFRFSNMTDIEVEQLMEVVRGNNQKLIETLKLKNESIDISKVDFSFMKVQPYDYQKQAVVFFDTCGGKAILGDSPGVGKTMSAIAFSAKNKLKTLVVTPASLKLNWKNEISRFTNEKSYIYKYKPKKNSNEIVHTKEESLFHIINYESLETYIKFSVSHKCSNVQCGWQEVNNVKKYLSCPSCRRDKVVKSRNADIVLMKDKNGVELNPADYDIVVCDEAHYIKNSQAGRTKLIKRTFRDIGKKLLLSGTAIKSRPYEFFSLLNFIDPNEWKNAHSFGVRYCAGFESKFGWNYDGASNLEELFERISPYFLRRLKKDVLSHLPPKTYTEIPIELNDQEWREYKKIERNIIDESSESDDDATHLSRILRLKQYTSHIKLQNSFELIQDIIDSDEKVVVFSQFVATTEAIAEKFGDKAVLFTGKRNMSEKQQAVDKFQNDENVRVFAGTIGAAGVGITLTRSSIVLFIDKPWTPSDLEQCEDRCHRASTTSDKVQIISLVVNDTIDVDIENLLKEKSQVTSKVLDGVAFDKEVYKVKGGAPGSIFKDLVKVILNKKT